jgi:nitroreductase
LEDKMDAIKAIKTRRSVRMYTGEAVSEEALNTILDCGRWAPSAGNRQPWRFIVIRSSEVKKRLSRLFPQGAFMEDAPLAIAVIIYPAGSSHPVEDGAAATQNMLLAAHALGLGACWVGSYNNTNEPGAKELLGVPQEQRILSVIVIGHAAETPSKARKGLDELVTTDKYGR